jgi:prefoldin subunit 5
MRKRRSYFFLGLAFLVAGSVILFTHSSIEDVGIVVLFIGTLFTIWQKLGSLEERINNACSNLEKHLERIEKLEQWREECLKKQ